MCTLVVVWMWVPWRWWLMVVILKHHCVLRLPYSFWPITRALSNLGPQALPQTLKKNKLWSDEYRRSIIIKTFFYCCQEGLGECKCSHFSVFVILCICFTIQTVVSFQYNLFIYKEPYDATFVVVTLGAWLMLHCLNIPNKTVKRNQHWAVFDFRSLILLSFSLCRSFLPFIVLSTINERDNSQKCQNVFVS